jgi:uncharacterized protein with HEPN domain
MGAFTANKGLFTYKQVKPIDTILVRTLVEMFITSIIVLIFLFIGFLLQYEMKAENYLLVAVGYFWLVVFSLSSIYLLNKNSLDQPAQACLAQQFSQRLAVVPPVLCTANIINLEDHKVGQIQFAPQYRRQLDNLRIDIRSRHAKRFYAKLMKLAGEIYSGGATMDYTLAIDNIKGSGEGIEFALNENSLKITQAIENKIIKPAIRMHLVRIAEQFSKLKEENAFTVLSQFAENDLRGIAAVRNYIAHDYDSVDDHIIEDVVRFDLPRIKSVVASIIQK